MKIVLYGATGNIGGRILLEALARGHEVTAIVRNAGRVTVTHPHLQVILGDIFDAQQIAVTAAAHDVVISAYGTLGGEGFVEAAKALIDGVARSGDHRLLIVGGAGSLEVAPGLQVVDTSEFPAAWKGNALAQRDALTLYRNANIDWTYLSPAGLIEAGERTGNYRIGAEQLVVNELGESRISYEDYAVAMLDEVEKPKHVRRRFTVAY